MLQKYRLVIIIKRNYALIRTLIRNTTVLFFLNILPYCQEQTLANPSTVVDSLKELSKSNPKRAIRYAREILIMSSPEDNNRDRDEKIYNIMGEIYLDLGMPSLALSSFIDSGNRSKSKNRPWNKLNIGNVFFQQSQWIEAKNRYLDALDIWRRNKNKPNSITGRSVALSNLGRIEMNLENYDDALIYFKEALEVKISSAAYKTFQRSLSGSSISHGAAGLGVAYQHSLLALLYSNWGIYDMALNQLSVSDSLLNYIFKPSINQNIKSIKLRAKAEVMSGKNHSMRMSIYSEKGDYLRAHNESKYSKYKLKDSPFDLVVHHEREIKLFLDQDSLYKALESLDRGIKLCRLNGMQIQELSLMETKVEIMKRHKLERSALDIANLIIEKKGEINSERMKVLLESLSYRQELNVKREMLKEAKARELYLYTFSVLSFFLVLLFAIYFSNKSKDNILKTRVLEQEKQIAENELKNKESELIEMSTFIVAKNDLLESIQKELSYHTSLIENKSDRKLMEPLKRKIKDKVDDSADWEKFQLQFTVAYPGFVEKLNSQFLALKSEDIKLCCYLKMNMSTREIARLSGLTVRAVENKRYRLRKKLELDTETSLDKFLKAI